MTPEISQPADAMSATNRSGRAMPVAMNTRDSDGTTTESRTAANAIGGGFVAGGHQRGIGRTRGVEPFAQAARGHRPIGEILLRHQQQVHVARQREMLEPVVQ